MPPHTRHMLCSTDQVLTGACNPMLCPFHVFRPCSYLSIDVMDISGEQQLDVMHTLYATACHVIYIPLHPSCAMGS